MVMWWESLSALQQVFACFALPATLILIIQTILLLFGIGENDLDAGGLDGDGIDAGDMDDGGGSPEGLALISVRGVVAFFTIGGWAGIVMAGLVAWPVLSVIVAMAAGVIAMYGVALIIKWTSKLQSAGNVSLKYAVGKTAEVYIPVPAECGGVGKVLVTFQGRFTECDAITDASLVLKSGERVKVVGLADANTLIVSPRVEEKTEFEVSE